MSHYSSYTLKPGMTPWEIVVAYFIIAAIIAGYILFKKKDKMNTLDYVFAGIGGSLVAVADHLVGDAIFLPSPLYPIINPPIWFRILTFFIVIGIIRKVGAGMLTMAVFDIVGDIIHFSFTGEPLWLIEDVLTYGLMADILIFLTKGKIFNIGSKLSYIGIIEGVALGLAFSFVHPF
ncbi:hypothetical protein, partial [Acidianus sp. RZ1]|uniref:hypothetical protein n=1 Tax=Acidianus sp. RZ1 TaxID=1540082 RepID=UPI0014932824